MTRLALTVALVAMVTTGTAIAQPSPDTDGVVVVNGGADASELDKLRKRIESLGVLHPTTAAITAALDNRPPYDLEPIRAAFGNFDFDRADELIETALGELFSTGAPEQMAPGAAELLYWRGLVAANNAKQDEALGWFVATFRIAPDYPVDNATASPNVRKLIATAKRSSTAARPLHLELTDPSVSDAALAIDGGPPTALPDKTSLALGLHLVVITAPKRKPFATMFEIRGSRDNELAVQLEDEDDVTRARRLRVETLDARSTEDRLKRARRLAKLTGARRFLVIGDDADLQVRVYDAVTDKVSSAMPLREALKRNTLAALLDVDGAGPLSGGPTPVWYKRWYVWAAVGAVVVGGAVGIYAATQREPSRITGF